MKAIETLPQDKPLTKLTKETLLQHYPEMLSDVYDFSIDDGWLYIIKMLLDTIKMHCETYKLPQPRVVQIKEKFGALRFYYDQNFQSFDEDENIENKVFLQRAYIDGAVRMAEAFSNRSCVVCGDFAISKCNYNPLCDIHLNEYNIIRGNK